jgi:hypothetical protein
MSAGSPNELVPGLVSKYRRCWMSRQELGNDSVATDASPICVLLKLENCQRLRKKGSRVQNWRMDDLDVTCRNAHPHPLPPPGTHADLRTFPCRSLGRPRAILKKKKAFRRRPFKSTTCFGSPTWARTRDLRINSSSACRQPAYRGRFFVRSCV